MVCWLVCTPHHKRSLSACPVLSYIILAREGVYVGAMCAHGLRLSIISPTYRLFNYYVVHVVVSHVISLGHVCVPLYCAIRTTTHMAPNNQLSS